ncbi:MAG: hypothetical protein ABIR70_20320 [Bryobacteraceae bacterium]
MKANLDHLRREVLAHLEERGFAIFKSYPRGMELSSDAVYWDAESYPDFREFVASATAVGVKMMTVFSREFTADTIDDALAQLAETNMDRDDRRLIEGRLKDFRAYEGFVCQLELSFAHGHNTYIFDQPTEWYEEMEQLIDQIEESFDTPVDESPLGGFYSNN